MTGAQPSWRQRTSPPAPLLLVRILFMFESTLYAAVTPVLPHYARVLGASKPAIGVLAAAQRRRAGCPVRGLD